ncbi:peptidase [Saccharothrix coeruleofusca]|uniref:Prenyltransferase/squalene oxidase-like repeat protein n=1 Tax=Saccharothrix coeruleofusca TaxID=33919 RepID=A0A918EHJ5_9PSEU|nr:peptidase [Saccharothrix coeruleofusca]GGP82146.1 hypothetical protein GCM10010185_65340 [Saccharothrix coeruleofusca]
MLNRKIATSTAAVALLLTWSAGLTPAHAAPSSPAPTAAGWLARQLVDGERLETVVDQVPYPDQGATADAVLAFAAAGVAQDNATKATDWLARPQTLAAYLGDGTTESYAGAHAKLALVAQVQGRDPRSFGGVDLISRLTALQAPSGRFSDKSAYGDYSNGITQSLAVIALERHGTAPEAAVDYLVDAACQDGGFPLYLEQTPCASDADTTGYAAQALLASGRQAEAARALEWLEGVQGPGGGFRGSGPTPQENANSTGLAAQALRVGGRTAAADKAVAFLKSLQVGCGDAARAGAIAYDATGFDQGNATRATTQGITGIVGVGLLELSAHGEATAPASDCPITTTTTTTTTTAVPATTTTAGTSTSSEPAAAAPVTSNGTRQLARTGFEPGPALALGVLLIATGVLALLLARPRRAER